MRDPIVTQLTNISDRYRSVLETMRRLQRLPQEIQYLTQDLESIDNPADLAIVEDSAPERRALARLHEAVTLLSEEDPMNQFRSNEALNELVSHPKFQELSKAVNDLFSVESVRIRQEQEDLVFPKWLPLNDLKAFDEAVTKRSQKSTLGKVLTMLPLKRKAAKSKEDLIQNTYIESSLLKENLVPKYFIVAGAGDFSKSISNLLKPFVNSLLELDGAERQGLVEQELAVLAQRLDHGIFLHGALPKAQKREMPEGLQADLSQYLFYAELYNLVRKKEDLARADFLPLVQESEIPNKYFDCCVRLSEEQYAILREELNIETFGAKLDKEALEARLAKLG